MVKISLKKKNIVGYLILVLLILIVGVLSIFQMKAIEIKAGYLTKEVATKVRLAEEIESSILFLKVSVEKFIYLNKKEDNVAAEKSISEIEKLLSRSEKEIKAKKEADILKQIKVLIEKYTEKYRNVAIRYEARNNAKQSLFVLGEKIQNNLELLYREKNINSDKGLNIYPILKDFMAAGLEIARYLVEYDILYAERAQKKLSQIIKAFDAFHVQELEPIKLSVEDYSDDFEGLILTTKKIDEEVEKTLLPYAPKIIDLTMKIYGSGWKEMDHAQLEIEKKVVSTKKILIVIICFAVLLGITAGLILTIQVIKPISSMIRGIMCVAGGDLTTRLTIKTKDELGNLTETFNSFTAKLQTIIKDFAGNAKTLNVSSVNLSSISKNMSSSLRDMVEKFNRVSTSSDEMNASMNSVAVAMEQTSANVGNVAVAAEQMTGMINNIAQNSEKARKITEEAVAQVKNASDGINQQGLSAKDIGNVTETITEISEKTNLLALNATIEAARAGEAGRGFAVVANEIKELARQTKEATQEIKRKIEGIQTSTSRTTSEIEKITLVIHDVNKIVSNIAIAVDDQSVTTRDIASNISQVSGAVQDVNQHIAQSSNVFSEIAKEIGDVLRTAQSMSQSSSQVSINAEELFQLSDQLKEKVKKFKL
ncbi:MAG: HAMP domain-containing protein [Desulfobacterales bacterium]|nr:HAMP domain-containing protein [Desulfobacterales bacterium]